MICVAILEILGARRNWGTITGTDDSDPWDRSRVECEQELEELEEGMWRPQTRGDRSWMEAHLAADFVEFGQSGRRYSRADILDIDIGEFSAVLPLRDLIIRPLGKDHVLLNYQSEMDGMRANRCSIWSRTDSGWYLEFHQGTPTTDEVHTLQQR